MRLHDYLEYYAREAGDTAFAIFEGREMSYADADEAANRIANALISRGLSLGDRIAVLAKNCLEFALLYYASAKAGVVPVPLNYRLAPREWAFIIEDSGAKLAIARGELVSGLDSVRDGLKQVETFIALDAPAPAGWESWASFLEPASSARPGRTVGEDDDVYQMYTSGTTGRPKGAVLTHRAISSNVTQCTQAFKMDRTGMRYLIVAPLYHAAAGIATFVTGAQGGTIYIQEDFVPGDVVRALCEEQIAMTTLVPAMIQACLVMVPDIAERSYEALRVIAYGASPISAETLRQAMNVFGCDFVQGYGMTETTAVLTLLGPADHKRALEEKPELLLSCGRPLMGTEVSIVDDDDRRVATGEIGQIIARGPQLMRGYWNLPEASDEALASGWMHTGDAGRVDEEGFVYIEDRVKDMIVSGGENVYPREVENVLFEHPAVADVAVIGIPDDRWGETVKAIVVIRDGARATEAELVEFCRGKLAGYKLPRSVDFATELPRNPSGKVLKKDLREPYWAGRERRVS